MPSTSEVLFCTEGTPTVAAFAYSPIKDGLRKYGEGVVMRDLYRHHRVMRAGWNAFSIFWQCVCLYWLQRIRNVSPDTCVAGVFFAPLAAEFALVTRFFACSCCLNVEPRQFSSVKSAAKCHADMLTLEDLETVNLRSAQGESGAKSSRSFWPYQATAHPPPSSSSLLPLLPPTSTSQQQFF